MSDTFADIGAELIKGQMRQKDDRIADLESQLAAERAMADISADRNYIAGMQTGFRLGLENDNERLTTLIECRRKNITEALQATAQEDK